MEGVSIVEEMSECMGMWMRGGDVEGVVKRQSVKEDPCSAVDLRKT